MQFISYDSYRNKYKLWQDMVLLVSCNDLSQNNNLVL